MITKLTLIDILKESASLHLGEISAANHYRPRATVIEYVMTSAFLRSIMKAGHQVVAEALCKKVVNVITSTAKTSVRRNFGKQRFDILIGEYLQVGALLELKINVRSGNKLTKDIDKILEVISKMDRVAQSPLGAVVFEVSIEGIYATEVEFRSAYSVIKSLIESDLRKYVPSKWSGYTIFYHDLADHVEAALIDSTKTITEDGAGTFVAAAIIEKNIPTT